jgi:hypothetical protein
MVYKTLFLFILSLALSWSARSQISQEEALSLIDDTPVSQLDSLLPKFPKTAFPVWFKNLVGPSAKIDWELNDCGEMTGVPQVDQERDIPTCLEVSALLPDQRKVGVAILVGTERKGLTDSPAVYNVYLEAGGEFYPLKRLTDLPRALDLTQKK